MAVQLPLYRVANHESTKGEGSVALGPEIAAGSLDEPPPHGEFVGVVDLVHLRALIYPNDAEDLSIEDAAPSVISLTSPSVREGNPALIEAALDARRDLISNLADVDEVMEDLYYVTLVKCKLETGRTHQIRVHMKYIGHTLFNDARYGGDKILKGTVFTNYKRFVENTFELLPRQALHAVSLGFIHPITKEKMHFETELPEDFQAALEKWRGYTSTRKELKNDGA